MGTWSTTTAPRTLSDCPDARSDSDVALTLNMDPGETLAIVIFHPFAPECGIATAIHHGVATLKPNQSCTVILGDGSKEARAYAPTSTLTLTSKRGATARLDLSAAITSTRPVPRYGLDEVVEFTQP